MTAPLPPPPSPGPMLKIPAPSVGATPQSLVTNALAKNQPDWVALAKATRSSLLTPLQPQDAATANAKADAIIKALSSQQNNTINGTAGQGFAAHTLSSQIPGSGADVPVGGFVKQISDQLKSRGVSWDDLPVETQRQIVAANASAGKALQAQNKSPSILGRVLDVISRPMYAVENTLDSLLTKQDNPTNPISAAWQGLEGKTKTSFAKVLQDAGVKNNLVKGVGGFAGDVALDPLTYLTFGTAKVAKEAGQGAEAADKALQGAKDASKALQGAKTPEEISQLLNPDTIKGAVPSARQAAIVTKNATEQAINPAAHAVMSDAISIAAQVQQDAVSKIESLLRSNGLRPTDPGWENLFKNAATKQKLPFLGGQKLPDVVKGITDQGAKDASSLTQRLNEIVQQATNPEYQRRLQLRVGRSTPIASVKLPSALESVGKGERAAGRALDSLKRTFAASSMWKDVNPERLHNENELAHRVNGFDREVATGLHGLTGKQAQAAFENLRNGAEDIGRPTRGFYADKTPVTNDAHFLGHMFSRVEQHLQNLPKSLFNRAISNRDISFKGLWQAKEAANGKPGWLIQHLSEDPNGVFAHGTFSNPKQVLHVLNHSIARAETKDALYSSLANLGEHVASPAGRDLVKNQGYRTAKIAENVDGKTIPYLKDTVFHPEIAGQIERLHQMLTTPDNMGRFVRGYDKANQLFKASVTRYLPSFYSRNLFNEVLNNFQAHVPFVRGNYYGRALKVLHSHGLVDKSALQGMKVNTAKRLSRALQSQNIEGTLQNLMERSLHNAPVGKEVITHLSDGLPLTIDQIWNLFVKHGGPTNFIGRELHESMRSERGLTAPLVAAQHGAQRAADVTELFPRLAHFIFRLEKEYANPKLVSRIGKNVVETKMNKVDEAARLAMQDVHKHHFDYTDLTKTEKVVMRRLVPFYTWTRKAIPYTIHMLATEPGRMNALPKALRGLSVSMGFQPGNNIFPEGDFLKPDWMRDEMAVPVAGGLGGKDTIFLNPNASTLYSIANLVPHPTDPLSWAGITRMFTPGLKIPFEATTGSQVGGVPIKSESKYFQGQNPILQYIEKLGGFGSHNPSDSTTIPNLLTGLGLVQNTKARQLSAAKHYKTVITTGLKGKKRPVVP